MVLASNTAYNLPIAFLQDFWLSTGQPVPQGCVDVARWSSRDTHCPGGSSARSRHSTEMASHVLSPISMSVAMEEFSRKTWQTHCRRGSVDVRAHNLNTSSSLFNINAGQAIRASAEDSVLFELSATWENVLICAVFQYLNTTFSHK